MRILNNNYKAELIAFGSRPDRGKTFYLCQYMRESLIEGKRVLLISFDNPEEEIRIRIRYEDTSNLFYYGKCIKDINIINDLIKEYNADIVFIDYLNLLPGNELAIHDLKEIAQTNNIPVVVTMQLSRKFIGHNIEEMSDEEIIALINDDIYKTVDKLHVVDLKLDRAL